MRRQLDNYAIAALCLATGFGSGCSQATRSLSAWLSEDGGGGGGDRTVDGGSRPNIDDDVADDDETERPDSGSDDDVPPEPEPSDDTAEPEPQPTQEPEAVLEPEALPEPETVPDPEAVPEPETAPEPQPETAPEAQPEPVVVGDDDVPVEPEPTIDSGPPLEDSGIPEPVDTGDTGPSCTPVASVEGTCGDALDDDCDGRIDCDDPDCDFDLSCCVASDTTEGLCDNTTDEDCDGVVDCADPDCSADFSCAPACVPVSSTEGSCSDRVDGDCDTLIDCADATDCANDPACAPACVPVGSSEGACADNGDGDCDGFIDCNDADCSVDPACQTACVPVAEDCTDGADNDCDTFIDCTDGNCAAGPACCVPSGAELCADGLDNDCNGVIDCPVIVSTVPELPPSGRETFEGGAVAANAARIVLQAPANPSYVVQCRSGKPGTVASKLFVACNPQNPTALTLQPFPDSDAGNAALDGVMITEVRFAYPNGQVSQPASFRYYVHSSLAGAQPCPRKAPDTDFLAAARTYLTNAGGLGFTDTDARLAAPFVNIVFAPRVSSLFTVTAGQGEVEYLSLRRRFTLNAEKDLVLMRRVYESRRADTRPCLTAMIRKHDNDLGPLGTEDMNRYFRTGCDVVVMNKEGAGLCMVVNGQGVISIANPQTPRWGYWNFDIYGNVNWKQADNFMWRKLLLKQTDGSHKVFSPKCYAGGASCVGTDPDMVFLPDRGLFPL